MLEHSDYLQDQLDAYKGIATHSQYNISVTILAINFSFLPVIKFSSAYDYAVFIHMWVPLW